MMEKHYQRKQPTTVPAQPVILFYKIYRVIWCKITFSHEFTCINKKHL